MYKIWKHFEKGQPHARIKQLEYTLIHHWRIFRSSYRKFACVGFEPATTEFCTDALRFVRSEHPVLEYLWPLI